MAPLASQQLCVLRGDWPRGTALARKEAGPLQGQVGLPDMQLHHTTHRGALAAATGTVSGTRPRCAGVTRAPRAPRAVRSSLSLLCTELRGGDDEPLKKRGRLEKGTYGGLQPASAVSPTAASPSSPGAGCQMDRTGGRR